MAVNIANVMSSKSLMPNTQRCKGISLATMQVQVLTYVHHISICMQRFPQVLQMKFQAKFRKHLFTWICQISTGNCITARLMAWKEAELNQPEPFVIVNRITFGIQQSCICDVNNFPESGSVVR